MSRLFNLRKGFNLLEKVEGRTPKRFISVSQGGELGGKNGVCRLEKVLSAKELGD